MVAHEQAIRRLKPLERAAQGGVRFRLAVMHEVPGDEDQSRVAVVRVDVGDRRLKACMRIEAVERPARRDQWESVRWTNLDTADYQELHVCGCG
jgi:hypothetical protein